MFLKLYTASLKSNYTRLDTIQSTCHLYTDSAAFLVLRTSPTDDVTGLRASLPVYAADIRKPET